MRTFTAIALAILCAAAARADLPPTNTQALQLSAPVNDLVWDATRGRFFVSSGASVLMINPDTAAIEDSWATNGTGGQLAISGDGQYLYIAIGARGVVDRYRTRDHWLDAEISLGLYTTGTPRQPSSMVVAPGQPQVLLVAFAFYGGGVGGGLAVYDGTTPRPGTLTMIVSSLYVRASDQAIFGWGGGQMYWLAVDAHGVTVTRTAAAPLDQNFIPCWSGNFASDSAHVFDLNQGAIAGMAGLPKSAFYAYPSIVDPSGQSLVVVQGDGSGNSSVVEYSLATFRATASSALTRQQTAQLGIGDFGDTARVWGSDGIVVRNNTHSGGIAFLVFFHLSDLAAIAPPNPPQSTTDATGVIHFPAPASGLAYDAGRNVVWATIPGFVGVVGNSAISLDPGTGNVVNVLNTGSEPKMVVLSGDGSHLFVALGGAPAVTAIDLGTMQPGLPISTVDSNSTFVGNVAPAILAPIPNQSNSVAVLRAVGLQGNSTNPGRSVLIYDNGVPRPKTVAPLVDAIYPGDTDNTLYGVNLQIAYGNGTHDFYRLAFGSQGFSPPQKLPPLPLDFYGTLVYSGGQLFTSLGQMWTPDVTHLNGAVGAGGIPIPFPDQNMVAMVQPSRVTTFDLATLRPLATYTFTGTMVTATRVGTNAVAVATQTEILLIPLTAMSAWPAYSGQMQSVAPGVQKLDIGVNAINALPGTSKLVLALPSSAGSVGNSIAVLNTDSGQIESSGFIGSEPTILRTAADGSVAYAYLSGESRVGRFNLATGARDLLFAPDPAGGTAQYPLVDMALGPDGGLTVSIAGGWLATFDNGVVRPQVDKNDQGPGAYSGALYQIALNPAGTIVYAVDNYWSLNDFKRDSLTPQGLQWQSGTLALLAGQIQQAGGLLYTSGGDVVDPERSRHVGRFATQGGNVAVDLAAGRVYFGSGSSIQIFDSNTYAKLAQWNIPNTYNLSAQDLVRYGDDGLAFHTADGHLYLVRISAIPLLPAPVPSPQPTLPVTPGVTVVDLATQDITYDAARNLIYGSVPNSEAAMGDKIVAIDANTGFVTANWPTAHNPNVLALADDFNHLYFSSSSAGLGFYSGFSPNSEVIRGLDLTTGTMGDGFPVHDDTPGMSYSIVDLAVPPGQPQSVAAIDSLQQSVGGGVASQPNALKVYDYGVSRPQYLRPHTFSCNYLVAGATASRMYCSSGPQLTRLAVDSGGVTLLNSFRLLPGWGSFGHMMFWGGRIYTTTGLVVDPEAGRVITRLRTQGPVTTDGTLVYWVDPSGYSSTQPSVTLRVFDITTLQPVSTKQINVTGANVTRLITCGQGRVAFRAGHEVYIVNP